MDGIISKGEWVKALCNLRVGYRIYVPMRDGDFHVFKPMEDKKGPDFEYQNTRLSPKSIIYPQSERMFECTMDQRDPEANLFREVPKNFPPQAVVGIRPCDAHALRIVKVNFDNPEYRDPWWVQRLDCTVLVGLGCNEPCSACFCTSVGGGPFHEEGLDALLYDLGEDFLVKALSEKGQGFLKKMEGMRSPSVGQYEKAKWLSETATRKIPVTVSTGELKSKVVRELFDAPFWEDVAFSCISCGTCTFLCPTCWCFDIQDEVSGKQGDRIRNWDSCMFPHFTLHGSGHNPRGEKFQRVRQRFMHKLKYYVDKYGNGVQCSGCGRCVRYCPVNIDIREVARLMSEYG